MFFDKIFQVEKFDEKQKSNLSRFSLRSEAKLFLTGSMGNGLATNASDLDLVLLLNEKYLEPQKLGSANSSDSSMNVEENNSSNDGQTQNKSTVKAFPSSKFSSLLAAFFFVQLKRYGSDESSHNSVSPATFSIDELLQCSVADRLDYFRRLLRSHAAHVCYVQRIIHARCPVLRFCHKKEKFFCELSINNQ